MQWGGYVQRMVQWKAVLRTGGVRDSGLSCDGLGERYRAGERYDGMGVVVVYLAVV
jgi:hypothetical protein